MEHKILLSEQALLATNKLFHLLSQEDLIRRGFSQGEVEALRELYLKSTERLDEVGQT